MLIGIGIVLILLGLFVAGLGWMLWAGIIVLVLGLVLGFVPMGEGRRWRYY